MVQPSLWEKESFFSPKDVIIVGSGFVGLWSAYYLKKANPALSVCIVERGSIPTGASTRNAGFACFGSVTELMADSVKMGEDQMFSLVEMRNKGLKRIRKVFAAKEISYEQSGGYELINEGRHLDINLLRSNIDWLNRKLKKLIKKEKVFHLDDTLIDEFGFSGISHIIKNRLEGQLHPGKLCQALLGLIQSMGVTLLNGIEIKSIEKINENLILQTDQSFYLSTRQMLICTNAFAKQLLPGIDIEPARGQVLVTSPIPDLRFKGSFHFDEGFYYFRNLGDRVLLGGARNKAFEQEHTADFSTSEAIQGSLEKFLKVVILPDPRAPFTIDFRWSGIMGIGSDKMPITKEVEPGVFCAVRMSGMGVALAPEIGKLMAEKMTGV
jgi:gamma-glutamylputrescine oxidase